MANALYAKGKEAFLSGSINLPSDTIKVVLVDSGQYTVNLATHQFLSDIPSGARTATSAALTGKSVTSGVFNSTNPSFPGATGVQSEYLVLYKDTGSAATSLLFLFIDTATGLPVTPNSGDINVSWDTGANKIFAL